MPAFPPRFLAPRRLAPLALAALCAGAAAFTATATSAPRTVDFSTTTTAPIDLGLPAPKLGVGPGTVKFRTTRKDRVALAAAKRAARLRTQQDSAHLASGRAAERIAAIQELLVEVEQDEARLRQAINSRLVAQYKGGEGGTLSFLLSGDGMSDLIDRGRVVRDQSARDRRMAAEYETTVARLQELELVLAELRDIQGERAAQLGERADRLDEQLVSARAAHMEAPVDPPAGRDKGVDGTWYVMDGAFEASLFLPIGAGAYDGGARTPSRRATPTQIQAVLADKRIELDASGFTDVATGQIDGRLLDALRMAAQQFGYVKVTSLKSDHGVYTASGNISAHSFGCAADIGTIGSTYITPGSQTPGSEVDLAVRFFASLPGDLSPHQVISLFDLGGATLAMGDHGDHIHLGYSC